MNKRIAASALLTMAIGMPCSAAGIAALPYPLTYAAAIDHALTHSPEARMERVNSEGFSARVAEAKGAFLPTLEASSTVQRVRLYDDFAPVAINANFNNTNIPVTVYRSAAPYQAGAGIELAYNLYAGGAHQSRVTEALAAERAGQAQEMMTRKKVVLDVTAAYWELRKAELGSQKVLRARDLANDEATIANEQFQQGRLAWVDLSAKLLAAEVQEIESGNAARSLQEYQRRYLAAIGYSHPDADAFEITLDNHPADIDVESILGQFGLVGNAAVAKAKAEFDSASASAAQVAAEYKPVIDFFVRYDGVGRSQHGFEDVRRDFGRDATTIGVRLKWNLFDGFRTDNRARQAYAASERARLNIAHLKQRTTTEWHQKLSREASTRDQVRLAEKQLELSRAKLRIAAQRLQARLISELQYRQAKQATEDAMTNVETAKIDVLVAQVERQLAALE